MANSPTDRNTEIMKKEHGTRVLITDPASDKYLRLAAEKEEKERLWRDELKWSADLDAAD